MYYIGMLFAIILIFITIDDLIWDIYYYVNKLMGNLKKDPISFEDIEAVEPKMLAILVAAYNEENVLKEVISNMIKSNHYPRSMYHIFLGVYPNDPGTQRVADELVKEFENVHKIVHVLDGPSSKADNLNNVIKNVYDFEKENNLKFSAIVVHDSEDLIHPYELKLENYLLEKHAAIQMPVFPLHEKTNIKNLYNNLISGTYADEFAENHYRTLVSRSLTGAFVPSAGTGFVIRRDVLESFPDHNVFPVGSLTEDYKLSLQIKQMGYDVYYALEDIQKTLPDGRIVKEFVSTRSMFPSNYRAAIRQKTRWIYGITMQSFSLRNILKNKELNLQSKYSLYKDWKAKVGNLLLGPGYLIFIYFIASFFIDLPVIYPKYSFSWYLVAFLSIIMIERQILRFAAVKQVYGIKSAIFSLLLPPLLPIKMVIGNIINFHATINAWLITHSFRKNKKPRKVKWSKTDHDFLEEQALLGFRRNLGDMLLYKGALTERELQKHIQLAKERNETLEDYFLKENIVEDRILAKSICEINQEIYTDLRPIGYLSHRVHKYGKCLLKEIEAIPLIKLNDRLTIITTLTSDKEKIKNTLKVDKIDYIYTTKRQLLEVIDDSISDITLEEEVKIIEKYIIEGLINVEQGLIALNYNTEKDSIMNTLDKMGLLKNIEEDEQIISYSN